MGVQRKLLAVSATRAGFTFLPGSVRTEPPVKTSGSWPRQETSSDLTFQRSSLSCVSLLIGSEDRCGSTGSPCQTITGVVFAPSDDRSLAGGDATAGIAAAAAADCRYLMLQQQTSDAAAAAAGVGTASAEGGRGLPVGTEAIGAGLWCGKIVRLVGTCG